MLNKQKIIYTAVTTVDEADIAKHIATIDMETKEVSFSHQYTNKEACKVERETIRKDQAEFEDFVYDLQEKLA